MAALVGVLLAGVTGCVGSSATDIPPSVTAAREAWQADEPGSAAEAAVTSSYLHAVLGEFLPEGTDVLSMAGPGMCPGHFDMRPSQIERLSRCWLLVRFDFQESLEARLTHRIRDSLRILPVSLPGSMCEPTSYRAACEQLAEALIACGRLSEEDGRARLEQIDRRLVELERWAREEIESRHLWGAPVLSSGHQEGFCSYLGLEVVGTFSSSDVARTSQIDAAVKAGAASDVSMIIANRPEGRQLADALSDRLGAPVVVLENFPELAASHPFDEMVRENICRMVEGAAVNDAESQ